ncbi:MAG TPA: DNA mismatch repair protein MutS [bacterium]|nr:DNA mismatch repair protein MutS [bacterium]
MSSLTPMMQQYRSLKDQHPNAVLLFRLGDFFEAFDEDAAIVARELQLTLTSRPVAKGRRIPMCGIPHHALHTYVRRLIDRGHRVAICDQVEDPKHTRTLVRREVVRIVTPGTVIEDDLLTPRENNFLAAVMRRPRSTRGAEGAGRADGWGMAWADLSTGEFFAMEGEAGVELSDTLALWHPREVLVPDDPEMIAVTVEGITTTPCDAQWFDPEAAARILRDHLGVATLDAFGLAEAPLATGAAGALILYLRETQKGALPHLRNLRLIPRESALVFDEATQRALALWPASRDGRGGETLLDVLDLSETPMGGRLLRRWLQHPLIDLAALEARLNGVESFVGNASAREALRARLRTVGDIERLAGRLAHEAGSPRDLAALRNSLQALPPIPPLLAGMADVGIQGFLPALAVPPEVGELLQLSLVDAPPLSPKDGGLIRPGVDPEIDRLRAGSREAREWMAALEAAERARTGIRSLKVGYNQVMGYYIEVSKANERLVPPDYIRKGTLVGAERYITAEMKDREALILTAQERIAMREYEVFCALRDAVRADLGPLQSAARALAELDALSALAEVAVRHRYVRPRLSLDGGLRIVEGRHPAVERAIGPQRFVPNDLSLGVDGRTILIVTGPNFGGKSTYIRQAALIVIMAQIGSYVPAREAEIGLVDRIFTRVGATDDLTAGRSTFLNEMIEVARILTQATARSLVILDEVGRGTSTYDGMSLAWAVVEDLHDRVGARTLFATHYHELTELAPQLARVGNIQVLIKEAGRDIVFLHRVADGAAASSYGIHVARLAGVPEPVIERAREVLAGLEAASGSARPPRGRRGPSRGRQLPLLLPSAVEEALRQADLARMTPLDALNFLSTLRAQLEPKTATPEAPESDPGGGGRSGSTVIPFPPRPQRGS